MINNPNHRAPSVGNERRKQWVTAIEGNQKVGQHTSQILVCENHFETSLIAMKKGRKTLSKEAAPSIFPNSQR